LWDFFVCSQGGIQRLAPDKPQASDSTGDHFMSRFITFGLRFALVASVAGCASLSTQFKQASEPSETEARARLRIISNSLVKAVPGKSCIDWDTPGAGTVFGGIFGSSGFRGRLLNIPHLGAGKPESESGEMYVAAEKPLTLVFLTTPEGISSGGRTYHCSVAGAFIPQRNKDYEAELRLEPSSKQCIFKLSELAQAHIPIVVTPATWCK
jgi:hypothetical protein